MAKEARVLTDKVVAITGAARGIGLATATACARKGMKVAIGDLDEATAQGAADGLGGGAVGVGLDVTDKGSFAAFLDETDRLLGPVDVLVNNAGIMHLGPFVDEDDATAQRMIDINVGGVLNGMKLVLPRFLARDTGHLVNVASSAGKAGYPGGATYCGTKHFVIGVSEAVRGELHETPIEVSCVMPGVVNTELADGLPTTRAVKRVSPEEVADAIVEALELPRFDVFVPSRSGRSARSLGFCPGGAARAWRAR